MVIKMSTPVYCKALRDLVGSGMLLTHDTDCYPRCTDLTVTMMEANPILIGGRIFTKKSQNVKDW